MKSLERNKIVLIGASTGGPAHIEKILSALQSPLNYTLIIAQHMGAEFLPSFVKRLSLKTGHPILLSENNQTLQKGHIYIATNHCRLSKDAEHIKFQVEKSNNAMFNPEINQLFGSAVSIISTNKLLAILLTGIGDDGVQGCQLLAEHGAECIAESEKTAIVYGIPARAKEQIPNINVLDLDQIIDAIQTFGAA
ncbi:CheB methylesterase domain-containing protein [Sulfurimonas sp. C5]|uniref:CheB methylesterase domain-containing protein n=1 Tax=Sulfurimonas sp. C5 TaxID=3036947 RepID=UPI0024575695|nr:CheB methylesterase domain-containing protein [Sulfurimonas sp. C5]MDH4944288.1 CheB methylesterase domain-containing protein [Sulfurimonas sp. C5]